MGIPSDTIYDVRYGESELAEIEQHSICGDYYDIIGSYQVGYILVKSFGLIITLANFTTRLIMIALARMIRCASVSRET